MSDLSLLQSFPLKSFRNTSLDSSGERHIKTKENQTRNRKDLDTKSSLGVIGLNPDLIVKPDCNLMILFVFCNPA